MADISGNAKAQPVGKFVIVALAMGQVLVSLDATAMNIALPTVQNDLGASSSSLQLIIVSYMIASAACTLPIAAISDRVGRKRMYTGGLLGFIFGSGLCAIAWSTQILVIARVIQGIGAAAIFGLALAILTANVDRARVPKIVAVWMTVSTVAFSAGPFVGGVLVSLFGWRSVFFINMPLTVLVLTVAVAALPNDRKIINKRPNLTGGVLIALTLSMFTWAIISIQQSGFMSPQVLLSFLFSCVLLAVLIFEQRHTNDPLVQWGVAQAQSYSSITRAESSSGTCLEWRAVPDVDLYSECARLFSCSCGNHHAFRNGNDGRTCSSCTQVAISFGRCTPCDDCIPRYRAGNVAAWNVEPIQHH